MGRNQICRKIRMEPDIKAFKPKGVPASRLDCVKLALDEFEAIRLADLEGLYHEEAAERMGVSRQTFGRIVASARQKVADALVNGKALLFKGGNVETDPKRKSGRSCGVAPAVGEEKDGD